MDLLYKSLVLPHSINRGRGYQDLFAHVHVLHSCLGARVPYQLALATASGAPSPWKCGQARPGPSRWWEMGLGGLRGGLVGMPFMGPLILSVVFTLVA